MPNFNEIREDAKYSNILSTLAHETGNLVSVLNNQVVTSSLRVAEYFGKDHSKVLRAINLLECSDNFRKANFGLSYYSKKNGNVSKDYPMYYMTRDGFTFLAMGFTGKVAAHFKEAYIEAFNNMERTIRENQYTRYAEQILNDEILQLNKRMKAALQSIRQRHGNLYGTYGDIQPGIISDTDMSFRDNLHNILAQVNNAYMEAFHLAGEYREAEQQNRKYRQLMEDISSRMARECKVFPTGR